MKTKATILVAIAAATFAPLACSGVWTHEYSSPEVHGKVMDGETGEPVPDAVVILKWEGEQAGWAHSHTLCYHFDMVKTNKNGEYVVPAWHLRTNKLPDFKDKKTDPLPMIAYKFGYAKFTDSSIALGIPYDIKIRRARTNQEFSDFLSSVYDNLNCEGFLQYTTSDEQKEKLIYLIREISKDTKHISETSKDTKHFGDQNFRKRLTEAFEYEIEEISSLKPEGKE